MMGVKDASAPLLLSHDPLFLLPQCSGSSHVTFPPPHVQSPFYVGSGNGTKWEGRFFVIGGESFDRLKDWKRGLRVEWTVSRQLIQSLIFNHLSCKQFSSDGFLSASTPRFLSLFLRICDCSMCQTVKNTLKRVSHRS